MLRRYRPAECKHVSQRLFYHHFYSSELYCIARGEILMRMAVAGVAVCHRLLDSILRCESACNPDRFSDLAIRHCPVGRDLPSTCITVPGSPFIHRRWNTVTNSSGLSQPRVTIKNQRVEIRRDSLDEVNPGAERPIAM